MKGRDAEHYVAGRLEEAGYECYIPPKAKYREQDVFGLFDILCFGNGRLLGVQVKAGRDAAGIKSWFHDARIYEETVDDLRIGFVHVCGEDIRLAYSAPDGYEWTVDERSENTDRMTFEAAVV